MPERRVSVVLVVDSGDRPLPKWADLKASVVWTLDGQSLVADGTVGSSLGEGVVIDRVEFP